jgi:hypothetical protein
MPLRKIVNLGGVERLTEEVPGAERLQESASCASQRSAAKWHSKPRHFLVLGVAAGQRSASCWSSAAAAMTGCTEWSCTLTSILGSKDLLPL